jgi:hypothetical protein
MATNYVTLPGMKKIEDNGEDLAVWIGPEYDSAAPKVLVLGESRYDEGFTDREIIEYRIAGRFRGGQRRTFTNFERAIVGSQCSDEEACAFWRASAFCNFNREFYPGRPRVNLDYKTRVRPRNASCLRSVLQGLRPTHVIVWGKGNWNSIDAESPWTPDETIPGTSQPFCTTTIGDHRILFTRVQHPSASFSWRTWSPVILQFLRLSPEDSTGTEARR